MSTQTTPPPTEKPAKTKKPRTKPAEDEIHLCVESKSPDGKSIVLTPVALPAGVDLKNAKHRNKKAIERAVEVDLEKGGAAITLYGGKKLRVVFSGAPFTFNVKVEEVKVTKVAISRA
jgi:hypothetical protein